MNVIPLVSSNMMNQFAERTFALEALIDVVLESAKELEERTVGKNEFGGTVYKVSQLLHCASRLCGDLAHDISDAGTLCVSNDTTERGEP